MADFTYICTAYDRNGVPRCWGEGVTAGEASMECHKEVIEYIKIRPDTAPLTHWRTTVFPSDQMGEGDRINGLIHSP